MTIAHLLVTLIYMPKEIIHNISVGWWGGDYVSYFLILLVTYYPLLFR